jgi:hypothetical protein
MGHRLQDKVWHGSSIKHTYKTFHVTSLLGFGAESSKLGNGIAVLDIIWPLAS